MRFLSKIRILFSKKDIFEYQQQLLNTHYQEVENMYRDIRKFRHNYRNHLQTLRSFVAENDMESIKNYLDNLDENLHSIAPVIRTGNRMADAILNSKITMATNENIKMHCRLQDFKYFGYKRYRFGDDYREFVRQCD